MFGKVMREEREKLGLSRTELRARILKFYETAPAVNTIRNLENETTTDPRSTNRIKILFTLSALKESLQAKQAKRNLILSSGVR